MAKVGPRPKNESAPECACGCGEAVAWARGSGWRRFRPGHQSRRQKTKGELSGSAPLCACGCGRPVAWHRGRGKRGGWGKWIRGHHLRVEGANNPNDGEHVRGDKNPMRRSEVREKNAAAQRGVPKPRCAQPGDKNPAWKGGRSVHAKGYIRVLVAGVYVLEHRLIMEEHLGRPLRKGEIVHHKNDDRADNRLENLELTNQSEHVGHHNSVRAGYESEGPAPVCACGCGRVVRKGRKGWNEYVKGHNPREIPKVNPFCACGCGHRVAESKEHPGLWPAFIRGHRRYLSE
jgi:hypothetical protein